MRFGKTIVVTALLGLMSQGCSNSQQQEQGLEVSADGQEVEVLETEEGAETQAAQSQEEVILEEGAEGDMAGTESTDPISTSEEIGVADDSLEAIAANLGGESEVAAPAADGSVALPMNSAPAAQPASASYLSSNVPSDGFSVMYAHGAGSLFDSPSQSANRIAGFESGDHFLVKAEGNWAKISDSAYIPANAVGTQAVPRARSHNPWK